MTTATAAATVKVALPGTEYDVVIKPKSLETFNAHAGHVNTLEKAVVMADENVAKHYGTIVMKSLRDAGCNAKLVAFKSGEAEKTIESVNALYTEALEFGLERSHPIIALGGGVTGDIVGFVAATYLRGVPFIQVPTTLLAMVDASVGGKTGYNHPLGKNLIGAFKQPELVLIDTEVLKTLPEREFRCGLAECIKHGLLGNWDLFEWMEQNIGKIKALDSDALTKLIEDNVKVKTRIVEQDEKESGVRVLLNFGHTFAHAIEVTCGYGLYLHGEAVALGSLAACRLAADLGKCDEEIYERSKALIDQAGLPVTADLASDQEVLAAMRRDKKVKGGTIRLILPTGKGKAAIFDDVDDSDIIKAWAGIRADV